LDPQEQQGRQAMSETIVCGGRQRMGTPEAPIAAMASASTPRPRGQPQQILHAFEAAMDKATRVCQLARGRPVNGMVECVRKLVGAERQRCVHILAAADAALKELG
jgi:hypothetical protein